MTNAPAVLDGSNENKIDSTFRDNRRKLIITLVGGALALTGASQVLAGDKTKVPKFSVPSGMSADQRKAYFQEANAATHALREGAFHGKSQKAKEKVIILQTPPEQKKETFFERWGRQRERWKQERSRQ